MHRAPACTGDGEGGGAKREDYTEEDVEYYFNYSGILAERGTYDTMEDLLKCKRLHIVFTQKNPWVAGTGGLSQGMLMHVAVGTFANQL